MPRRPIGRPPRCNDGDGDEYRDFGRCSDAPSPVPRADPRRSRSARPRVRGNNEVPEHPAPHSSTHNRTTRRLRRAGASCANRGSSAPDRRARGSTPIKRGPITSTPRGRARIRTDSSAGRQGPAAPRRRTFVAATRYRDIHRQEAPPAARLGLAPPHGTDSVYRRVRQRWANIEVPMRCFIVGRRSCRRV
jgi:hypothetical protein